MSAAWLGRLLRGVRANERYSVVNHTAFKGVPETITLESEWFPNGRPMPRRSAGPRAGENISPPLTWKGLPSNTAELAVLMEDLDVPLPRPILHMIAYGISPGRAGLAEGALARGSKDASFGRTVIGTQGYFGPGPVPGHGPHHYVFYLLALNRKTEFQSPPRLTAFLQEIAGRLIAYGRLTGTYEQGEGS